jgi:hypothetical protein
LSDIITRVIDGERIVLDLPDKQRVAIVPYEDLELLEALEGEIDLRPAQDAMKEEGELVAWEDLKRELGL